MRFLKKLKSGNFWVSMISAGVLIAEVVFDFEIKTEYLNQILLGLLGLLTVFGIVSDHGEKETILQNLTSTTDSQKQEGNESFSNIKSICDTISLMLNKVSINSNNFENVKGEKMETETLKETEKEESVDNTTNNAILEDQEDANTVAVEEKVETLKTPIEETIVESTENALVENEKK